MNTFARFLLASQLFLLLSHATAFAIDIAADQKKIKFDIETITLGDTVYEIPEPWIGNRIPVPTILPSSFKMIPTDHASKGTRLYITKDAHSALLRLFKAALDQGLHLKIESGYRSPGYQKKIFSRMLGEGRDFNDIVRYVAPPGYSQHALGTAVDFYPSNWRFAELEDYKWLQENAADYGFTETYPEKNSLHYPWEAWHWNYTPIKQNSSKVNISNIQTEDQVLKVLYSDDKSGKK